MCTCGVSSRLLAARSLKSSGRPRLNTWIPAIVMSTRCGSNFTPDRPAAASRQQDGGQEDPPEPGRPPKPSARLHAEVRKEVDRTDLGKALDGAGRDFVRAAANVVDRIAEEVDDLTKGAKPGAPVPPPPVRDDAPPAAAALKISLNFW